LWDEEKPAADADTGLNEDTGTTPPAPPDPRFDALRAAIAADLSASTAAGVSVAVYENGAITFAEGFGSTRPSEEIPVTADTLFHIGSTTKMLTAIAVLQDVEDGALSLDTPLAVAYPNSEFSLNSDWNDELQIHHLLSHTAGTFEYYDQTANPNDSALQYWYDNTYFEYFWLMSPPGAFWNYSNANFSIAGLVLEHLSGDAYADLMTERVFAPLGMDRTYMRKTEAEADGDYALGNGYSLKPDGSYDFGALSIDDVTDPADGRPAGAGTWSTPTQMMAVADFLLNGAPEVLSDDLLTELTSTQSPMHGFLDTWSYGYGLMLVDGYTAGDNWYDTPSWGHGGATLSGTSEFAVLPEHDFAISILSSTYGADFSGTIQAATTSLLDLGEPADPPAFGFDSSRLDDHVGTYEDPFNVGTAIVTRSGSTLEIEMPDLEAGESDIEVELQTLTDTIFLVTIDGTAYDITFIGEPGSPSQHLKNRSFVLSRTAPEGEDDSP
jgi:CubicO group peptidase (beta-lactamase class C family)